MVRITWSEQMEQEMVSDFTVPVPGWGLVGAQGLLVQTSR